MGNTPSMLKINFEDMQTIIKNPETYLLINTLPENEQNCLIKNTTPINQEEKIINKYLNEGRNIRIVVYGRNVNDEQVTKKYNQLLTLGFYNIYIYTGGLFEWLLLQDVYGAELFPTTSKELDLLKFKTKSTLNICYLEN